MNIEKIRKECLEMFEFDPISYVYDEFGSLYMLENGSFINFEHDGISRCEDHRCMLFLAEYYYQKDYYATDEKGKMWHYLHNVCNLIRLVPETRTELMKENQLISDKQSKCIEKIGFSVEVY